MFPLFLSVCLPHGPPTLPPQCWVSRSCGLNKQCTPWPHGSEHSVFSWQCYLGRLQNTREVQPHWGKCVPGAGLDGLRLAPHPVLGTLPVWGWNVTSQPPAPRHASLAAAACFHQEKTSSSKVYAKVNIFSSTLLFVDAFFHNNKKKKWLLQVCAIMSDLFEILYEMRKWLLVPITERSKFCVRYHKDLHN